MSQALSNLAVGSKVKFGSYSVNGEAAQPIVWTIVAKNHTGYPDNSVTLHTSEIIDLRCFDAKEPNNADSNRQNYGNNRYSVSNIDQWLNKDAAGGEWYSAAHNADHSPDTAAGTGNYGTQYAARPGFLNGFTDNEKAAILSTTIRVADPNADGGSYEDVVRKVFLPSSSDVGLSDEHYTAEGAAWGYYTSNAARIGYVTQQCISNTPSSSKPSSKTEAWSWWLRTPYYLYSFLTWAINEDGAKTAFSPTDGRYGVRPALNVPTLLNVSDTTDNDGCYTFEWSGSTAPDPTPGGGETGATQALGNLPIGAKVKYGKHSVNGETPEPIIWTIVDKNHTGYPSNSVTLNTTQIIDVRSFDSHEPNNPNTNRATYGNNNYQVSNLDQWLNKSDADGKWYQAAHAYDYPPSTVTSSGESSYVERPGFLHFFTSQERASLLNTTLKVLMPRIDTNAGTIQTISRKVFLLSLPEVGLGKENGVSDGTAIAYFTSATRAKTVTNQVFDNTKAIGAHLPSSRNAPHYWWLRTPYYADTFTVTGVFNTTTGTRGDYTAQTANIGVAPAINLSSSLRVTTTTDEDGCYTFVWPSKPGAWVGGTEKYTSNEIKNITIWPDSLRKDSPRDDLDEFVSNISGLVYGFMTKNDEPDRVKFYCYVSQYTSTTQVGTEKSGYFTFARDLTNVVMKFDNWGFSSSASNVASGTLRVLVNSTVKATLSYPVSSTSSSVEIGSITRGDILKLSWTATAKTSTDIPNSTIAMSFTSDPVFLTPEIVSVPGTRTNDRRVSSIYAGVIATVPVYTETTTTEDIALSSATFTDFFSADNTGTTGTNAKGITWTNNSGGGLKLKFGNYGINSSTSMTTFTAQRDLTNVVIKGLYYTESNFDKITLTVAGTTVLNAVSGTSSTLTQRWTGSLSKGQTIVLKFVKDSSQSASNEKSTYFTLSCDPYQKTTVNKTQTGTETKLTDKKIVKAYVGVNGVAKKFYGNDIEYTGDFVKSSVTHNGKTYTLYTLTSSGSLNVLSNECSYWACGGGAGGGTSTSSSRGLCGGAGGFVYGGNLNNGQYTISIGNGGAAGGVGSNTTVLDLQNNNTKIAYAALNSINAGNGGGINGASGGGRGYYSKNGSGISNSPQGINMPTRPFSFSELSPASAGGGAGAARTYNSSTSKYYYSGIHDGGSNGGYDTNLTVTTSSKPTRASIGGEKGGGTGGMINSSGISANATSATYYGSGGGGAAYYYSNKLSSAGSGYQGCVMLLFPKCTDTYTLNLVFNENAKGNVVINGTTYTTSQTLELPWGTEMKFNTYCASNGVQIRNLYVTEGNNNTIYYCPLLGDTTITFYEGYVSTYCNAYTNIVCSYT